MPKSRTAVVGSSQIELTAAAWLARRDAGAWSDHDQAQLRTWLDASVAHRVAFLRLDAAWLQSNRLRALGAGVAPGMLPARGSWGTAAARENDESVEGPPKLRRRDASRPAHESTGSRHRSQRQSHRRLLYYARGAFVFAVTAALTLGWHRYSAVEQAFYRTVVGQLQDIPLADGSVVTLSSDSRILVTLSHGERHIELQQGEAFFKVAKNPGRPFVVSAGDHRAVAVGTRYDVRRDAADLRVIVIQGVVRLESDHGPNRQAQPTALLPAGSVALASDDGVVVHAGSVRQAEDLLGWRSGFIAFHDTPLAAAAAEFNRYNTLQIIIGDASVGRMRVGGSFRWSNAGTFAGLLEQGFPIRAERSNGSIVLKRR